MNKNTVIFIIAIVVLLLLSIAAYLFFSKDQSDTTPLVSCNTDNGVDPCQTGYMCYDSQIWPKGGIQGPQEGDLKCHQKCETSSDCPDEAPNCEDITIWKGDVSTDYKLCTQ
ncbi:hypothetical protein KKG41_03820 [Patescibacteria group bacterium]|nr:hypothetical protein [Patescibacteria group bacterium]MBU1890033.1 hypothetical protein [Patescibacteria group bacterium]